MQKPAESKGRNQQAEMDALNERAAAVQPTGYGVSESVDPEALVAEQDAVQRTPAHLTEPLRVCLLLALVGQFSTDEIADMLDIDDAAVRQPRARARTQLQQSYALERGRGVFQNSPTS